MKLICRYLILLSLVLVITLPCILIINFIHNDLNSNTNAVDPWMQQKIDFVNISATNQNCRFDTCFDISRCQPNSGWKIKVYIYPERYYLKLKGGPIFPKTSYEFDSIIYALKKSTYITNDPEEACLFIPLIDLLSEKGLDLDEVSSVLNQLPYWNEGNNHLLFNFFPMQPAPTESAMNVEIGNAMVASSNLLSSSYRQGYDISIPLFNSLTVKSTSRHNPLIYGRKWKLVISQLSVLVKHRNILRKVEDSDPDMLLLRKCLGSPVEAFHYDTLCKDGTVFSYPNILGEGTFCLILPSHYYGSTLLLDALMMGCIPVIVMDEFILPFTEFIDWRLVSVELREYQLPEIMKHLSKVSTSDIYEKRYNAFHLWKKYFSSINRIVDNLLDMYNERIYTNQKKTYEDWNGPFGTVEGTVKRIGAKPPIFIPFAPAEKLGFTAVILTYNRVHLLFMLMKELEKVPSLSKIIIVWNNPYSDPYENQFPVIKKAWKLIKMKTNRLSNRFFPFEYIETEAVLAIDDDILMLTPDELEFAYQTWLEYPDRMVGFPARAHEIVENELIDGKVLNYKYDSEWRNDLSMVLTGAAMYHKVYNHWYTYMLPVQTRNYIDAKMNCEDIGMNFLISSLTGKPPIKVTPRKRFKCAQCSANDSLWSERSHFVKRSECLSVFTNHFGRMPLEPVEFRVDPLLFQEDIPVSSKAFPDVGVV